MDTQAALDRIQLFADLTPLARRDLAAVARSHTCRDGQVIVMEDDPDSPVFILLEGCVRVFHVNPDGREQTLIYLSPGAVFNMPAAFTDRRGAPASAVAVGPTKVLSIARGDFRRIASQTPEIALTVLRDLSAKLLHFTSLTYDLSLRSVRGRLARFLLQQGQPANALPVRWTHEEIATRIGSVREVVSRTLRAFARDGLIKVERQHIVVLDRDALAREAES